MAMARVVSIALFFASADAIKRLNADAERAAANPIRKVVTMLQNVQKKVEEEGEKEEELYEKFMCYCKNSGGDLQGSIATSDAKVPELTSAIQEAQANKDQIDADLIQHKTDRESAKSAMAEATKMREKEAAAFAAEKAEYGTNGDALMKAVAALEKGVAGAFLQSNTANALRKFAQSSMDIGDADRQELMDFLSLKQGSDYAPASGEIIGILKQIGDEIAKGLAEATATEEAAIKTYEDLMAAKTKEVAALTSSIEEKTVRTGELAVSIVNMKKDLDDTSKALLEDKQFLADLEKNCELKTKQWEEIKKTRAEELVALADTIKILNDDDALELFKKTLPSASASLVQLKTRSVSVKKQALAMIHAAQQSNAPAARQQLNLLAMALQSKSIDFTKVLTMIDNMVALLKKEQIADDDKKTYCAAEFDKSDDQKKALDRSISDSQAAIDDAKESIATLTSEIKALTDGVKELDKQVAEATENRQKENEEYKELMAGNAAAKELLEFAKNRLNKFYNPKLYVAPPKRELSAEDTIVVSMGGTAAPTPAPGGIAGTGVTVLAQVSAHGQSADAPPPPPETFDAYSKKSQETTGVIAMMDMLMRDLEAEMTTAEADEKDAQADYEKMVSDAAAKRGADSLSIEEKESAKADTEAALQSHTSDKDASSKMLMGTLETIQALHSECDWLMQNFDVRKEARASEMDSLTKAKSVLSGADFSM